MSCYEVCRDCLSPALQVQMWVHANSGKVLDSSGGYSWCDLCEQRVGDGEVKYTEWLNSDLPLDKLTALASVLAHNLPED